MSENRRLSVSGIAVSIFVCLILFFVFIFGLWGGIKVFNRHQRVADANNQVKTSQILANNQTQINAIRIKQQAQLVKVAKQKAQIRYENSVGVRRAQDEIAKTLTPLYVQFEMVEALKDISKSGRNSSVVYLPSGTAGIPLVSGVAGQPSVKGPQ